MKKGQEYVGVVTEYHFPNKGIVVTQTEDGLEECVIKNVLVGQKIRYRVTKKRGGKCEGQMLELIEKSPTEVDSPCPHFDICGGCVFQTLPYEEQLAIKDREIHEILEPIIERGLRDRAYRDRFDEKCAKIEREEVDISSLFEGIKSSPIQHGYRNKMEFSFGDSSMGGPLELGLHKSGSFYDIVTVRNCQIIDEDYRKILVATLNYFRGKDTPYFHKRTHEGYLRHLIVRKAAKTEEIIIDIVTSSQKPYDTPCTEIGLIEDWQQEMLKLQLKGVIVGIMHTTNDSLADAVINEKTDIMYGRDYIMDNVLGLDFKITPFSFFQTNTLSAEVLYDTVREYVASVDDKNNKVLFDLYSGTGTITQLMSTVANKVIGVEIVDEAVEAAKENANINGLHNCEFIAGDVLKVLDDIVDKPDFIILDPPRDGINPKALAKIIDYGVENIVYVSCKPTSLARDLEVLMAKGYTPKRICPIDQFPGTVHVETVCLLSKLHEAKHHINVKVDMDELNLTSAEAKATYKEIEEWVQEHYGVHVTNLNIAQVKQKHGIIERENYNKPKSEDSRQPGCPEGKS